MAGTWKGSHGAQDKQAQPNVNSHEAGGSVAPSVCSWHSRPGRDRSLLTAHGRQATRAEHENHAG